MMCVSPRRRIWPKPSMASSSRLFINVLPHIVPDEGISVGNSVELITQAREAGDATEARLNDRLSQIRKRFELRRFDVFGDVVADIAAREARSADAFVAIRPEWRRRGIRERRRRRAVRFGAPSAPRPASQSRCAWVRSHRRRLERQPRSRACARRIHALSASGQARLRRERGRGPRYRARSDARRGRRTPPCASRNPCRAPSRAVEEPRRRPDVARRGPAPRCRSDRPRAATAIHGCASGFWAG